ncbi:MAG: trigger factor [Candidatus Aminicenantales bacterium]
METRLKIGTLKSNVKTIGITQREIEAELQAEDAHQEFNKIVNQYAQKVKIKGFRTGKAPQEMVRKMFFPEIQKSLMDAVVPQILKEILESQNIDPVGLPVIQEFSYEEGKPLRFKAKVDVWPDFELPEYKGIKVNGKKTHVEDEEIQKSLEELRQKAAEYIPVEGRGVTEGDYVVVELQGKDQKTGKRLPAEKMVVLAGHPENEKILNESLLGLKPQEKRNFTQAYPPDHGNKKLAGKDIEYVLHVVSIKEKQLPELNDEFAKNFGKYEHLSDLKEKVKEELFRAKENAGKKEMAEAILQILSDRTPMELPESAVEQETLALLEKLLSSYSQRDLGKDQFGQLKAQARKQAELLLKKNLILRKITEKEAIAVSEEEIDQEIRALAHANNLPLSQVIESINQGGKRENLRSSLLYKKAVDFLLKKAIISYQ